MVMLVDVEEKEGERDRREGGDFGGRQTEGQKLSLSMRNVDQHTGKDLLPLKKRSKNDALRMNPFFSKDGPVTRTGLSGIRIVEKDDVGPSRRPLKRMSSPEKWEAKQLIASGVLGVTEYPMYDEEIDGMLYQEKGAEEKLEIELNEDEPAFLNGQGRYSVDMSPVKIFKNPEGSLGRAVALRSALIKERRGSHNRIPAETMRYIQNQNHRQPAQGRSPGVSASVDVVVGNQRRR
ncbi:hypothetical protein GBA52_008297 [Prunus armeniaca]|nr:hypothetical protein GBA52_008297 [Prunus armeniaca]